MRVTVPTSRLLDAVGHAAYVAAVKSTKPIYECVALRADPATGLSIEATDLDVAVRIHVDESRTDTPGSVALSAARLLAIVREIEEDRTTFAATERGIEIATAGSRFTVRHEDVEDFPALPRFPAEASVRVPSADLRDMVRRTAFATAKDAGRFALHGVQMRIASGRMRLVGTDGRRMASIERELPTLDGVAPLSLLIGPKALLLLDRVLGSGLHGDVEIALVERQIMARSANTFVTSRMIDGSYPDVDAVIPRATAHNLRVGVAPLAAALRRVTLLTTREARSIEANIEPGLMRLRSRAPELGEAQSEIEVTYDGPALRLGFNSIYVAEALKAMGPAAEITIGLGANAAKDPLRLTDSDDYVYVLSPVPLE